MGTLAPQNRVKALHVKTVQVFSDCKAMGWVNERNTRYMVGNVIYVLAGGFFLTT